MAVGLLSLPRLLGFHPETGAKIQAGLGRYGPYVVHDQGKEGKDYRSLKAGDDVLTVTLERALELLAQPKRGRGRGKSATPLRELGQHPEDEAPVNIYNGPYGPYVKHGKVNASIPEGTAVEDVTLENAVEWLAAKAATKKKSGRKSTKSTTKGKTTKKSSTTAKKSSSKSTKSSAKSSTKSSAKSSTRKTSTRKSSTKKES
jgi:DNA topoisomerase-1